MAVLAAEVGGCAARQSMQLSGLKLSVRRAVSGLTDAD